MCFFLYIFEYKKPFRDYWEIIENVSLLKCNIKLNGTGIKNGIFPKHWAIVVFKYLETLKLYNLLNWVVDIHFQNNSYKFCNK